MIDAIVTYTLVILAAAFVAWRFILPVRTRTLFRHAIAGTPAPCQTDAVESGCSGGCAGCGLAKAKPVSATRDAGERLGRK